MNTTATKTAAYTAARNNAARINLRGYRSSNISRSDAFQTDILWALTAGGEATVAELAATLGAKPGRVTYHLKKLAAKGSIVLDKAVRNNRRVLVAAVRVVLPAPKGPRDVFKRLVLTAKNKPTHLSRASDKISALAAKTGNYPLTLVACALNEQRHLALLDRLGGDNAADMARHAEARATLLRSAEAAVRRAG